MTYEILKSLNWAQVGIAICGIGVVIFTLLAAGMQQRESSSAEHANTLLNQEVLRLSKENLAFAEKAEQSRKADLVVTTAPDLRITGGQVTNSRNYRVIVANYGKSTAEEVQLTWDYAYATTTMTKLRELPPGASTDFTSQMFPLEEHKAMEKTYAGIKDGFAKGEKVLIVRLTVQHIWQGAPVQKQYTIVWDGSVFRLL